MKFALKELLLDMELLLVQHAQLVTTALLLDLPLFLAPMECGLRDQLSIVHLVMTGIFANRLKQVQLPLEKPAQLDLFVILMI